VAATIGEDGSVEPEDTRTVVSEIKLKPSQIGATIGGEPDDTTAAPIANPRGATPSVDLTQIQQRLLDLAAGKVEDPEPVDTDMEFFYDGLKVIHLPEWRQLPADRIQIPQWRRVADALYEQGYRRHPELEAKRWQPSPGTTARNPHDIGAFVERRPDGTWPIVDPEEFYSPEGINVSEQDGKWCAVHERAGIVEYAESRMKAYLAVAHQLESIIESAKRSED